MIIEQALFGEVRSGHGLRLASDSSRISSGLAARLDLPDSAPSGCAWSPFVSGFPYGEWYVLARTFADPSATRPGMVLTHAVLAPLSELVAWSDLRPLFALLIKSPQSPASLQSMELQAVQPFEYPAPDLVSTAKMLVDRGQGPVVRVGLEGFEDLACALWFHFWPSIRASFAFRLSFGPHDLVETLAPSLVCTPKTLAVRWSGYRVVRTDDPQITSRAAAMLSGGAGAQPILRYAHEIGAQMAKFADLSLVERAYNISVGSSKSTQDCIALIRLVERLSPDRTAGIEAKKVLVNELASRLMTAEVEDVLLLRNISTNGFSEPEQIWSSIQSWMTQNHFAEHEDAKMISAIEFALSELDAIAPWRQAILEGLHSASLRASSPFPIAFWRWASISPNLLKDLAEYFASDSALEKRLLESAPSGVTVLSGKTVMAIGRIKNWLSLHGRAAGISLPIREAIDQQFLIDSDLNHIGGLQEVLRDASNEVVIELALELEDPRTLQIAAERVAQRPGLLADIDFTRSSAQTLWLSALRLNASAWQGPKHPHLAFLSVIQNLLESKNADLSLIAVLSETPLADLCGYQQASEVWDQVTEPALSNLMKATGSGWLQRATAGEMVTPDSRLIAFILAGDGLDSSLRELASTAPSAAVQIIGALPGFGERRFIQWLHHCTQSSRYLSISNAEAIGRLILRHQWRDALEVLSKLAIKGNETVGPALRICESMLGLMARLRLRFSSVSNQEKWEFLEQVAVSLYPQGPDHEELWSRSGGSDADLEKNGNGRSRWHRALIQVRQGKAPRAARLLLEMAKDFPDNEQVQCLMDESSF